MILESQEKRSSFPFNCIYILSPHLQASPPISFSPPHTYPPKHRHNLTTPIQPPFPLSKNKTKPPHNPNPKIPDQKPTANTRSKPQASKTHTIYISPTSLNAPPEIDTRITSRRKTPDTLRQEILASITQNKSPSYPLPPPPKKKRKNPSNNPQKPSSSSPPSPPPSSNQPATSPPTSSPSSPPQHQCS